MNHSETMVTVIEQILNEKDCYELARKENFIQRSSSKLKGHEFIKALIIPSAGSSVDSLDGLAQRIKKYNSEADLTAQAICDRINTQASVGFLREVFLKILQFSRTGIVNKYPYLAELHKKVNNILLEDSTICTLNAVHQKKYEGTNKNVESSQSQVKIDLIHNFTTGTIIDVEVCSGKQPDQGLSKRILKYIKTGDLVIRDLGYFVLKVLKGIADALAYFLTRVSPNIKVFLNRDDIEPIDLGKYLHTHYRNESVIELDVFLGDFKLQTRLVLYRVPEEVKNQRLRDANKRAKGNGRTLSKAKKTLISFTVFATNLPKDLLSAAQVGTVYRLRWEIELIFKQWKSQLKIDHLEGINPNRIDSLIWSRLCTVVLMAMICSVFLAIGHAQGVELSPVKLINYFLRDNALGNAVRNHDLRRFMDEVTTDLRRRVSKNKRQLKTMRERFFESENYYECVA